MRISPYGRAIVDIAQPFECGDVQPFGLVHDQQLHGGDAHGIDRRVLQREAGADAKAHVDGEIVHVVFHLPEACADGGRVEDGAAARGQRVDARVRGIARAPFEEERLDAVPVGVAARRPRLAYACWSEAQADRALAAHGAGELDEATVLAGGDEARHLVRAAQRRGPVERDGRHAQSSR